MNKLDKLDKIIKETFEIDEGIFSNTTLSDINTQLIIALGLSQRMLGIEKGNKIIFDNWVFGLVSAETITKLSKVMKKHKLTMKINKQGQLIFNT